ncbi:SWIM zinc finger family protein [uncultured Methanobrevibacter sp.]|uniref:SWIM zinc finger family protein n=1 Tax=uncultured Methanobrevibacter sp. TaxID=253161 RepID=UPI0034E0A038
MQYNSPTYASCNCPKKYQCKHEVALIYYLINHSEIYVRELNLNEMVKLQMKTCLKNSF